MEQCYEALQHPHVSVQSTDEQNEVPTTDLRMKAWLGLLVMINALVMI